jgi:hypothetical protein
MTSSATGSSELRRSIGSYPTYEAAQRVVDALADRKFPVEHVTIVGSDLRLVEQVTGRLTVARAALAGAATGAWFGLLIGLVFWIVSPWALSAVIAGVGFGLLFGAILGAITHAVTGGRRDFASVATLTASRYEVLVDAQYADEAMRLLGQQAVAGDTGTRTDAGQANSF